MRFSEAMEMEEQEVGRFLAHFDRSWWVDNVRYGGVIAAMMVRADQHC